MKISPQSKVNFTSRSLLIRQLDDLMRYTNNQFPRFSDSQALCRVNRLYNTSPKFREETSFLEQLKVVFKKLNSKRVEMRSKRTPHDKNYFEFLKDTISQIRLQKQGNCGESASLALAVLKANGYENVQKVALSCYVHNVRLSNAYDHAFVLVNVDKFADLSNPKTYGKKAVVVDAWSGFVDYADNVFRHFESKNKIPIFNVPFSQGKQHGFRLGCFSDGQTLAPNQVKDLVAANPFLVKPKKAN